MTQKTRDTLIFIGLIAVKALATARTAVDMWTLTHDVLNVALLDGMMLAFWLAAAYGGKSKSSMALRPFAAIGAWLLYGAQVYVGWAAHHTLVAFLVRLAPGLALLYDTYEYIVQLVQRKGTRTREERRTGLRGIIGDSGYYVTAVALAPVQWLVQVAVLGRDVLRDTRATLDMRAPAHVTAPAAVPGAGTSDPAPVKKLPIKARRARVRDMDSTHTITEMADKLNVDRKTIYRDRKALGLDVEPVPSSNGHRHEVPV